MKAFQKWLYDDRNRRMHFDLVLVLEVYEFLYGGIRSYFERGRRKRRLYDGIILCEVKTSRRYLYDIIGKTVCFMLDEGVERWGRLSQLSVILILPSNADDKPRRAMNLLSKLLKKLCDGKGLYCGLYPKVICIKYNPNAIGTSRALREHGRILTYVCNFLKDNKRFKERKMLFEILKILTLQGSRIVRVGEPIDYVGFIDRIRERLHTRIGL